MHPALQALRIAGEVAGTIFLGLAWFFAILGAGLGNPAAALPVGMGYVLVLPYWLLLRWLWPEFARSPRVLFDSFLLAVLPAVLLTIWAYEVRFPYDERGYDAHGWGTTGSEKNLLLFSWLHMTLWAVFLGIWMWRTAQKRARFVQL